VDRNTGGTNSFPIFGEPNRLPRQIGSFQLASSGFAPKKEFGVNVCYIHESDGYKVDVYIYDLGLPELPRDLESSQMDELFRFTCGEVITAAQLGLYSDLEFMTSGLIPNFKTEEKAAWLWAAFRYKQKGGGGARAIQDDLYSHLALWTRFDFIHKVRCTYNPDLVAGNPFGEFVAFLHEWDQLMRYAAEDLTASENDAEDDTRLQLIRNLEPPFAIDFFDANEARSRELLKLRRQWDSIGYGDKPITGIPRQGRLETILKHEISHHALFGLEAMMALDIRRAGFPRLVVTVPLGKVIISDSIEPKGAE
jgi:hypothetical protein